MKAWVLLAVLVLAFAVWWWLLPGAGFRGYAPDGADWEDPIMVQNILTPDECQQIIKEAAPNFKRSTLVAATTIQDSRTSETAWLPRDHPLVRKVLEKAMKLTGKPFEHCEDMQVVRYKPGMYYRPHHDSCCESNSQCKDFETKGGQRVGTLLLYLNDGFTDGHTHFPNLDLKLKADPGSAIFFRPLGTRDPRCHPRALHAGLPISSGTKYVCNIWVREGPFTK